MQEAKECNATNRILARNESAANSQRSSQQSKNGPTDIPGDIPK